MEKLAQALEILTPTFLWIAFSLLLLIFIAVSIVLVYHWRHYSFNLAKIKKIITLYFAVSAIMILGIFVSLLTYIYD